MAINFAYFSTICSTLSHGLTDVINQKGVLFVVIEKILKNLRDTNPDKRKIKTATTNKIDNSIA